MSSVEDSGGGTLGALSYVVKMPTKQVANELNQIRKENMKHTIKQILATALGVGMVTSGALGVTLEDRNAVLTVDPNASDGSYNWTTDGVDHLYQQWFWYRVGDTGPETSIDQLVLLGSNASDSDFDSGNETLNLLYGDAAGTFEIGITYTLTGGNAGSGTSDVAEQISIHNLTDDPLDFHFFQYSDFDLNGTPGDDTAELVNSNTVRQSDPGTTLSETVVTPAPNHWEIATFPTTLSKLQDSDADDLSDSSSPLSGDVTWAFQWDFSIAANGSKTLSKDKNIAQVPEAGSTLALLGLAITGIGMAGRRFRR